MKTAQQLFDQAFYSSRELRSEEYRAGVLAALTYRTSTPEPVIPCPYTHGTASADAWFADCDEWHAIWRAHAAMNLPGEIET